MDPMTIYLAKGLEMVDRTMQLWNNAKGNSTSSYRTIHHGESACTSLKQILTWLALQSKNKQTLDQENDEIHEHYQYISEWFGRSDCRLMNVMDSIMKQPHQKINDASSAKCIVC
jgi:hypothetical protein